MEYPQTLDLEAYYMRPRIGQRFSLLPGPFAPAQKRWKTYLPWRVWAEMIPERAAAMREALGIGEDSTEAQTQWQQIIEDLARGSLLVRVIRLHPQMRIPPGETRTQRQGRLDRWLPAGWKGDGSTMRLRWLRPARFACPARSYSLRPREVPLLTGPVAFDRSMAVLRAEGAAAHWMDDGQIWVFCRQAATK